MDDVLLSRIGTCVTILCAIGSVIGWCKSRRAATDAQLAVREIRYHRNIRQASTVHAALSNTLKSVRQIGVGCNVEKIVGINIEPIIDETEIFLEQLQEVFADSHLKNKLDINLDEFLSGIRISISSLSDSILPEDKLREGRDIYSKLSSLKATIGNISNEITFNPKGDKNGN
ncbi:hypothetical protein [Xenorhabdus kozodoii]|uniref:Uncharacterized protein n=1 Tax=Xenorhabdus kozodoii TaxID=351676 RepID=A0A2D0KY99_9GAMM|nr:hypothetical protein [Xenorhabdus kozodoii]PHM68400.1 hypothetical protein Xkoz_03701 [Xenorhabdus kozodoii]